MKLIMHKAIVLAAVAILSLQPVMAQAQVAVGNANKIVSSVQGVLQSNTRTLVRADDVFSNEKVNTGANSAARFIFQDNTILSVGANSSVILDKFVFNADVNQSQVALSMSRGVMRFVSGRLPKRQYSIRTPTSLIGIRGTILVVTVAASGLTNVSVIEGAATVSAAGTTTTVQSGFSTSVSPGGPPTPPSASPPSPPQVQNMQTALGPEPGGETGNLASASGFGDLSNGALLGGAALAAALAVAIAAASSDDSSTASSSSAQ